MPWLSWNYPGDSTVVKYSQIIKHKKPHQQNEGKKLMLSIDDENEFDKV